MSSERLEDIILLSTFMILSKATKKQGFTLTLENTFLETSIFRVNLFVLVFYLIYLFLLLLKHFIVLNFTSGDFEENIFMWIYLHKKYL